MLICQLIYNERINFQKRLDFSPVRNTNYTVMYYYITRFSAELNCMHMK